MDLVQPSLSTSVYSGLSTPEWCTLSEAGSASLSSTPSLGTEFDTGCTVPRSSHSGKYLLACTLQHGSTATVYLGHDPHTGEAVAIKHVIQREASQSHVTREIKVQTKVDEHPNIATIKDAYDNGDGTISIALEYMPNGDLIDIMSTHGSALPITDALRYGLQIASAVSWMHAKGIAHRDLKCENVCIADDGTARIIDFGQAHPLDDIPSNRRLGTVQYMPLESWLDDAALESAGVVFDPAAADVWAFGVLMYCLLTARFPWAEAALDNHDFMMYATGRLSEQMARHWNQIPLAMRFLLNNTLAVDPSRRWTMETVCAYLENISERVNQVITTSQPVLS